MPSAVARVGLVFQICSCSSKCLRLVRILLKMGCPEMDTGFEVRSDQSGIGSGMAGKGGGGGGGEHFDFSCRHPSSCGGLSHLSGPDVDARPLLILPRVA